MIFSIKSFPALACLICHVSLLPGEDNARNVLKARAAVEKAVQFYRESVSVNGGSVYRVSADLSQREGEERVGDREAWIEPPATSAVGMAYLRCWQWTGEKLFYDAMLEVADGLMRGQLESGGWAKNIEFDPLLRTRYAYRVDHRTELEKRFNRTTFDDNKSQSSLVFLMSVDRELEFKNAGIHEAALFALDAFAKAQYANGAWPQQYSSFPDQASHAPRSARFPERWSRTYEKVSYTNYYTLNDNTLRDLVRLMLTAYEIYGDERWLNSAMRGGDFLIAAQLPEPQPGWSQQYNENMEPAWARKFEPPSITGLESQGAMETLLLLYDRTAEEKYLKPVKRGLEYYRSIMLDNDQLARFYEIGTDRPLYFTRDYELVYTDDDLPTHYGFKVGSKLDKLETLHNKVMKNGPSKKSTLRGPGTPKLSSSLAKRAAEAIQALDKRGAWVEKGALKNFNGQTPVDKIIDTRTYTRNILTLAEFIAAAK